MADTGDGVLVPILGALARMGDGQEGRWFSAVEISHYLRDSQGVAVHWRTIDTRLREQRTLVSRKKKARRKHYMLLEEGRRQVGVATQSIVLIDPENSLQAVLGLHGLLGGLVGAVAICDPYFDEVTVEHLGACPKACRLRVLTMTVRDSGPLRRVFSAAKTGGHEIEVCVAGQRVLHDRYIIDESGMLILGTSLNGFGKKQSFVVKAGEDLRSTVLAQFDQLWSHASPWP